jgi:hypothetical protein
MKRCIHVRASVLDHRLGVDIQLIGCEGKLLLLREPLRSVEGREALIQGVRQVEDRCKALGLLRRWAGRGRPGRGTRATAAAAMILFLTKPRRLAGLAVAQPLSS